NFIPNSCKWDLKSSAPIYGRQIIGGVFVYGVSSRKTGLKHIRANKHGPSRGNEPKNTVITTIPLKPVLLVILAPKSLRGGRARQPGALRGLLAAFVFTPLAFLF